MFLERRVYIAYGLVRARENYVLPVPCAANARFAALMHSNQSCVSEQWETFESIWLKKGAKYVYQNPYYIFWLQEFILL